jgi:multidrug resistance efflux pump
MPGVVASVVVTAGQAVKEADLLLTIEAHETKSTLNDATVDSARRSARWRRAVQIDAQGFAGCRAWRAKGRAAHYGNHDVPAQNHVPRQHLGHGTEMLQWQNQPAGPHRRSH